MEDFNGLEPKVLVEYLSLQEETSLRTTKVAYSLIEIIRDFSMEPNVKILPFSPTVRSIVYGVI